MRMKHFDGRSRVENNKLNQLQRVALSAIQKRIAAKTARQEKRTKRMLGWSWGGTGSRQAARYRQQEAYRRGLVTRRALPNDPADWIKHGELK